MDGMITEMGEEELVGQFLICVSLRFASFLQLRPGLLELKRSSAVLFY